MSFFFSISYLGFYQKMSFVEHGYMASFEWVISFWVSFSLISATGKITVGNQLA